MGASNFMKIGVIVKTCLKHKQNVFFFSFFISKEIYMKFLHIFHFLEIFVKIACKIFFNYAFRQILASVGYIVYMYVKHMCWYTYIKWLKKVAKVTYFFDTLS